MPYKYKSILKSFEYSKDSYKIISDFLLSGDIINPDVKLKVNEITNFFKPNAKPRDWFRLPSTKAYISALINIRLEAKDSKLEKIIRKWIKDENITLDILFAKWRKNPLSKNIDLFDTIELDQNTNQKKSSEEKLSLNLELFEKLDDNKLMKLLKDIDMVDVKRGNEDLTKIPSGTWINRDLAIEYARWLDPRFSIWVSKKIQELIMDGVAWNEIRAVTKRDYLPLTDAIKKYIIPKYPKVPEHQIYSTIGDFPNKRVRNQKAREIRIEKNIKENELTRDYLEKLELQQIEKIQIFAEILISQLKIHDLETLEKMIMAYEFPN